VRIAEPELVGNFDLQAMRDTVREDIVKRRTRNLQDRLDAQRSDEARIRIPQGYVVRGNAMLGFILSFDQLQLLKAVLSNLPERWFSID
jgi:hypothetical protein